MKKEEIKKTVTNLIEETLGIDPMEITEEAHINNDLGADSLDAVELIMNAEKEFKIRIDDEDAEKVGTVGDLINLLDKTINA